MPVPTRVAIDYRPAVLGSSGIGRSVRELARALAAGGEIDLHLFAHSLAAAGRVVTVPAGARLHRLPVPGRSLGALCALGIDAARLAGNAQVFHWTDYVHPPVGKQARVVLTVHDLAFAREPAWFGCEQAAVLLERTRAAARRAAAVVAPTTATARDVERWLEPRRIEVIPFGADHEVAPHDAGARHADEPPHAICIGTIEPRKNHARLLQAWRLLPEPRPRLVVVGRRGWECAETVAALQAASREGWLTWHEHADDAVVARLLERAALCVYPSLWEGFGFPPLEAMRAGVPVVCGDCEPLRENCADAALGCDARDPAAVAVAVQRVLTDAALRERMVQRGREMVQRFRWVECARRHAELYREVCA